MRGITIGEAAQRTGLSVDTLRYYERAGLIDPVRRAPNGRRYDEIDLLWLAFLRRLRATGMPIAQMRRFARLRYAGDATTGERRELLEEHASIVRDRIAELSESLEIVERKITHFRHLEEASRSKPTMTPREPRPRRASTDQAAIAERAR
jgi:DNA-binding transcriptional MerR regulator